MGKNAWKVSFVTLFPEIYPGVCDISILGRARQRGLWSYDCVNIRDYGVYPHRQVDDTPYGGGPGMVLRADVIDEALKHCGEGERDKRPLLFMSARGKRLCQQDIREWSKSEGLRIVCGRFEGIDQRVMDEWECQEISVSDVVLTGGEVASMLVTEACVRLLEGVVGEESSLDDESFGKGGILEYPHYTRPQSWNGVSVPDVLLSGNHALISEWRILQAEDRTLKYRKDLWDCYKKERELLTDKEKSVKP